MRGTLSDTTREENVWLTPPPYRARITRSCPPMRRLMVLHHLRLSRFKLAGPPTLRDTEVSNAYAIIHDSLGPVYICSLIGINSNIVGGMGGWRAAGLWEAWGAGGPPV